MSELDDAKNAEKWQETVSELAVILEERKVVQTGLGRASMAGEGAL